MNIILKHVAEGDGYANRLLSDPAEAERLSRTISNLDKTSAELAVTASEVRQLVSRINRGPGFAHSVIYEQDGNESIKRIGTAAEEVGLTPPWNP